MNILQPGISIISLERPCFRMIRIPCNSRHSGRGRCYRQFQMPICVCGESRNKKTSCDSESDDWQRFRVQSSNESEQLRPLHEWNFILLICVCGKAMAGTGSEPKASLNNSVLRMIKISFAPNVFVGKPKYSTTIPTAQMPSEKLA